MGLTKKHAQKISVDGRDHFLKFLRPQQIIMIDESLAAIHKQGEIRLVVERNRLRFIVNQTSFETPKWQSRSVTDTSR